MGRPRWSESEGWVRIVLVSGDVGASPGAEPTIGVPWPLWMASSSPLWPAVANPALVGQYRLPAQQAQFPADQVVGPARWLGTGDAQFAGPALAAAGVFDLGGEPRRAMLTQPAIRREAPRLVLAQQRSEAGADLDVVVLRARSAVDQWDTEFGCPALRSAVAHQLCV